MNDEAQERPINTGGVTAEQIRRAERRVTILDAMNMAEADGRLLLAWLLERYLAKL